jgi:hypothetical protein
LVGVRIPPAERSRNDNHQTDWDNVVRVGNTSWFGELGKYGKPDAHLYEVCYVLDKSEGPTV